MASYQELVFTAKSPREAIIGLAVALDDIATRLEKIEAGGGWDSWDGVDDAWQAIGDALPVSDGELIQGLYEEMESREPKITETEDSTIIDIPPPSEKKKERRREFERNNLKIAECLGSHADTSIDYNDVYAKGGPLWLYHGNRELFMSYGPDVRAAMCQDIIEDSPQQGHLVAIDALKQPGESGPGGVGMATDTVDPGKRVYVRD